MTLERGTAGSPEPTIVLEGVSKAFNGGSIQAIRAVSLTFAPGSFVAIVGGSGSGKTTLLKLINRLIDADHGTVTVAGREVRSVPAHELRRHIGYVFQEVGLFPHLSIGENIAITPRLLGWTEESVRGRVAELIELIQLPHDVLSRMPAELSGGQRQRVGVARALAAKPSLMLMDEPFGALDPITRDALGTEYRRLHEAMGLCTVMVTHDVMEAVLLADRIIVMRQGEVVADGTPAALLSRHEDEGVRDLMETPWRQARRISALVESGSHAG